MGRRGTGREMDRIKGREEDLTFWLFARNPLSSQVTMGRPREGNWENKIQHT